MSMISTITLAGFRSQLIPYMRPHASADDCRHTGLRRIVAFGDTCLCFASGITLQHVNDIRLCVFRVMVCASKAAKRGIVNSFGRDSSPFLDHVLRIVLGCSHKQVMRVATTRIVASMTDEHPRGNFDSKGKLVGQNVSRLVFVVKHNAPVTFGWSAFPRPALVLRSFINLIPKVGHEVVAMTLPSFTNGLNWLTHVFHVINLPTCYSTSSRV